MNIKFSILMSIYHKESPQYFDACMHSLWYEQSLKPTEIVLVKDGSLTLGLDNIISKWQSELNEVLVVVSLEKNVGLGKALNIGLSNCSNEWVFRMDTDDICVPDRFEKQINFIKNHPDISLLSGQIKEFDGSLDNIMGVKSVPLHHNEILEFSKTRNPFNHMAIAYKRSVIESVGGYQHHIYMEDYNLWLRVLSADFKAANLEDTLVMVRAGEDMIKRRKGKVYLNSEWQLFNLKRELNYQSTPKAILILILRSAPRLLPTSILAKVYAKLRSN
ncbi:glycosyltransferase [Psychrobacter sanguinis]|uniref:glycosyltransferase n=1 Tax=Psychrobacter sanguinis TaxID=861445 RepID=UPI00020C7A2D|nr:glycosyltransferase [Psychrobacter sanguinis]EGK13941.1 amylovoran biosynthesis glycosyltransferase AmsE [Psychrobacter sp. 1501(2011)]MCD9150519.1 glycosyltransferase [Psychrobacter sanguinis]